MTEIFKLFGKIAIENKDANNGIDETKGKAEGAAEKIKAAFSKIGDAAVAVGKTVLAGLGVAATAVSRITKEAIDAYADYEQLVGGVETLFKDSSDKVVEYASQAYKTAGLSANDYMETVTGFSASLLQSLDNDTNAAAEKANTAITDMSDNANKMGTSMESIQNAYQGFAKQNYTMLDNLKLGYGGTKEEMERLLSDAEKISGIRYDISSFADITDAIHVVQTEMGITGTTAKEAATTIQGSVSTMKASWTNLLAGLADENQDFDTLLSNFVDSVITVFDNIIPRVKIVFDKIPSLVSGVVEQIPQLIEDILPSLITAATNLLQGLTNALPQLLDTVLDILPTITTAAVGVLTSFVQVIADNTELVVEAAINIIQALTDAFIADAPELVPACVEIMVTLATALLNNLPTVIECVFDIIIAIFDAFGSYDWTTLAEDLIMGLINGINNGLIALVAKIVELCKSMINAFKSYFGINSPSTVMQEQGGFLADGLINGIKALPEKVAEIFGNIKDKIKTLIEGARDTVKSAIDKIKSFFNFSWSLPKLKMPHITIEGEFSLDPLSVPHFGIEWYAKGGILNDAAAFGINPASNSLMVGGEAGPEAVAPIETLQAYVKAAVAEQNNRLNNTMDKLIAMLGEYLPGIADSADKQVVLSTGEVVGALTPYIDTELGNITRLRERGC